MTDKLLRLPEVRARTARSRSSIYQDVKNGSFPPPINIGPRAVAWLESTIDSWIAARIAASNTPDGRGQLKSNLQA